MRYSNLKHGLSTAYRNIPILINIVLILSHFNLNYSTLKLHINMAKREFVATTTPTSEDILAKISELDNMLFAFFNQFSKTTPGLQSIGEVGLPFVEKCAEKVPNFPEILSATFDKSDFNIKLAGVQDFFTFKQRIMEMLAQRESSAKTCKTDAMYFANEYYGIVQKEAARTLTYKPTLDELMPFYKKSKADKTATLLSKKSIVSQPTGQTATN